MAQTSDIESCYIAQLGLAVDLITDLVFHWMSDALFGRRLTLAGGQEFNGLELWRALYMKTWEDR